MQPMCHGECPAYRDFRANLIGGTFGSRQQFCQATGVDPRQLSRVFAGRSCLSFHALGKVLEVMNAHLILQTEEQARKQTSVAGAKERCLGGCGHLPCRYTCRHGA